ncbi:hypothetical protein HMN09_01391100 [Mycena chlorophos]|uniref:Uncharacterized protein n=1 Tax=Mycena chlorophos TaxID=658473 RepID=A0A8H6RWW6_MYCCL|nr:hypothetical protein HMN09_01391100 [Mycena chlorophos]
MSLPTAMHIPDYSPSISLKISPPLAPYLQTENRRPHRDGDEASIRGATMYLAGCFVRGAMAFRVSTSTKAQDRAGRLLHVPYRRATASTSLSDDVATLHILSRSTPSPTLYPPHPMPIPTLHHLFDAALALSFRLIPVAVRAWRRIRVARDGSRHAARRGCFSLVAMLQ